MTIIHRKLSEPSEHLLGQLCLGIAANGNQILGAMIRTGIRNEVVKPFGPVEADVVRKGHAARLEGRGLDRLPRSRSL